MDIQEVAAWASVVSSGAVVFSAVWVIRHVSRLEHKVDLMWGWFEGTFLHRTRFRDGDGR